MKYIKRILLLLIIMIILVFGYSFFFPGKILFVDQMRLAIMKPIMTTVGNAELGELTFENGKIVESKTDITLEELGRFLAIMEPGDIFMTNTRRYLSSEFIPGQWKHSGIYLGNKKDLKKKFGKESLIYKKLSTRMKGSTKYVLDSSSEGVHVHPISELSNLNKNSYLIGFTAFGMNTNLIKQETFLLKAVSYLGTPYDFDLREDNDERVYCSELIFHSLKSVDINIRLRSPAMWREIISPNDLFNYLVSGTVLNADYIYRGCITKKEYFVMEHPIEEFYPETITDRNIHDLDIVRQIKNVIVNFGYSYDNAFTDNSSVPSEYLTDLLGILPIKMNADHKIINDFVPEYAKLKHRSLDSIVLDFDDFVATIYLATSLKFNNIVSHHDHIRFHDTHFLSYKRCIQKFYTIVNEIGQTDNYFIKNQFYPLEQEVYRQQNQSETTPIQKVNSIKQLDFHQKHMLVIFSDKASGNTKRVQELNKIFSEGNFDWIALEMLSIQMQTYADAYLQAEENSELFNNAQQKLSEFYQNSWKLNSTSGNPLDNPFMKLLKNVKAAGIPIYALEPAYNDFLFFRGGETEFGGAVRSCYWAQQIPLEGKGLIFGDGAHFKSAKAINFQDFVESKVYKDKIYIIE